jgi:hypothetical protein
MTASSKNAITAGSGPSRPSTLSSDGTTIGWITKGAGQPLLLVYGSNPGLARLPSWFPARAPRLGAARRQPAEP